MVLGSKWNWYSCKCDTIKGKARNTNPIITGFKQILSPMQEGNRQKYGCKLV